MDGPPYGRKAGVLGAAAGREDRPSGRGLRVPGRCLLWRCGKMWLGKAVGSPEGCPVSAPVSAGVRLAPHPAAVVRGLRSVIPWSLVPPGTWQCHCAHLGHGRHFSDSNLRTKPCGSRKQGSFSRVLHPAHGTHPHPGEGTGGHR